MKLRLFLFAVILLVSSQFVHAEGALSPLDSVVVESVPFGKIPSSMAQTKIKTSTLLSNMVSAEYLSQRKLVNDTIAIRVNSAISALLSLPQEKMTVRYVGNSQLEIKKQKAEVEAEVDKMADYINALDRADSYVKKEAMIWAATSEKLVEENYSDNMLNHVSSVDSYLDSAHQEISSRTEMIFFILELCTRTNVALDEASTSLDEALLEMEEMFATAKSPMIFNLSYDEVNLEFLVLLGSYLKNIVADVKNYSELKSGSMIVVFMIFMLFTYLFFSNKDRIIILQERSVRYYQRKLGQILTSPLSAAMVLTLALAAMVLKDRPLAVKNVMLYLSLVPLFLVSRNILKKELHRYLIAFFLLVLPIISFSVFPPNNIFYRYALLFLSVCEILIILHFYLHQIRHNGAPKSKAARLGRGAIYVLLAFSLIGFFAAVLGKTMIAQRLLLTTFFSVYGAAILYSSSVMINGLFISCVESEMARKVNAFAVYHEVITKKFVKVINFVALYIWCVSFLKQLKMWEDVSSRAMNFFQYEWQIGVISVNVGNIIIFFVVIYISTLLSRALQIILEGDVLNKMDMAKGLPHSIAVMVRYTLVVLGVVVAVSAVGLEFSNLAVVFGALGVGIGFGLQSIFNNLVSGFILLFERPVKIGDTVEIGTLIGKVKTIGIRSSNIQTIEGAEVIVPNGHLVSNEVINWTLSDQRRRIDVMVGVSYDSDPQQVKRLLEGVLNDHPLILKKPRFSVYFLEMGESSLDFRMLFWTSSYSEWYQIRSEVVMSTFETLKKNGIEIPFPQRDINIKRDPLLPS